MLILCVFMTIVAFNILFTLIILGLDKMNKKPKLVERVLVSSPWTVRCCSVAFKFFLLGRETKSGGGGGDRKAEEEEE